MLSTVTHLLLGNSGGFVICADTGVAIVASKSAHEEERVLIVQ